MEIIMTTSKKIILLVSAMLMVSNASMWAMHQNDKTEADRIATLKAKAKADKAEQADEH